MRSTIGSVQRVHRQSTRLLSLALLVVGVTLVALTLAGGGGLVARGVLLGAMLAALGVARLYLVPPGSPAGRSRQR